LLQYTRFLPVSIKCTKPKCKNLLTIRPCSREEFEDRMCFRCSEKCNNRKSIRGELRIECPKSLSIIAYATTIFDYFPKGLNTRKLEIEIEVKHHPSHLSKKSALTFLANIRRCIRDIMIFYQDSTLL
jgi:hypothetical protein